MIGNKQLNKIFAVLNCIIMYGAGVYYIHLCEKETCMKFITNFCLYIKSYYILHSLMYIYEKKYIFLPHHVCAFFMTCILENMNDVDLKNALFGLTNLEISGAITNIRDILKDRNELTLTKDGIIWVFYVFIRQGIYTYNILYQIKYDTVEEKIFYFMSILIYMMSFYWSVIWAKSIIKYNNLFSLNHLKFN